MAFQKTDLKRPWAKLPPPPRAVPAVGRGRWRVCGVGTLRGSTNVRSRQIPGKKIYLAF